MYDSQMGPRLGEFRTYLCLSYSAKSTQDTDRVGAWLAASSDEHRFKLGQIFRAPNKVA
jgi:hypothetical protein